MNKPLDAVLQTVSIPESKVYGATMGPTWGRQDPGGPHVGPMNLVIWDIPGLLSHIRMLFYVLSAYNPHVDIYVCVCNLTKLPVNPWQKCQYNDILDVVLPKLYD